MLPEQAQAHGGNKHSESRFLRPLSTTFVGPGVGVGVGGGVFLAPEMETPM